MTVRPTIGAMKDVPEVGDYIQEELRAPSVINDIQTVDGELFFFLENGTVLSELEFNSTIKVMKEEEVLKPWRIMGS